MTDERDDDSRLVDRASRGDPVAIETLLTDCLPGLRAFVRLRMGPELRAKESVSDLVQSACKEVLQNIERFQYREGDNFRHWLFTTALRKVRTRYKFYRAAKRDMEREVDLEMLADCYRHLSTPSNQLMRREQVERFESQFHELPERYQEVILLSRVVGLSRKEVAAALGRTEPSVRSLLHRALAKLSEAVDHQP